MTSVEIHFRLVTIRERLQQLQGELIVIGDELGSGVSLRMIATAERRLQEASDVLQSVACATTHFCVHRDHFKETQELTARASGHMQAHFGQSGCEGCVG